MRGNRSLQRCGCGLILCLPWLAGCPRSNSPSIWLERQEQLEVPAEGATRLVSATQNGHQTLTGSTDAAKVTVGVYVRAGGSDQADAQAALDAILVTAERVGEEIKIGWKWKTEQADAWDATVDFEITLPAALATRATAQNGAIAVHELAGPCSLETQNGKLSGETSGPELRADTDNGTIEITTSAAAVDLECTNGSISARLTAAGEVGGRISIHNGGVAVAFGDTAAAALDCKTVNGSVHCQRQLAQSRVKPTSLSGSINGGKQPLKIEAHNGSIKIE